MRISDWSSDVCSSDLTVSLTLAVTSTDSRALTVLSARMRSCQGFMASVVVVTTSAGASPRSAAPSALQAARHRPHPAMAKGEKRENGRARGRAWGCQNAKNPRGADTRKQKDKQER